MTTCVKCNQEATYDSPENFCDEHWARWWANGLGKTTDEKEQAYQEVMKTTREQAWKKVEEIMSNQDRERVALKDGWVKIGVVGIDAGLLMLADPCYILQKGEEDLNEDFGKDWHDFCNRLHEKEKVNPAKGLAAQFNYDAGHPGLACAVSTGWGDGEYPVYARIEQGRIAEVRVDFMCEEDEEETDF